MPLQMSIYPKSSTNREPNSWAIEDEDEDEDEFEDD